MRAITVIPGKQDSVALTDMPEPPDGDGPVLVRTQAIGICGTDLEIINGEPATPPLPNHLPYRVSAAGTESVIGPGLLNRNMVLQNSMLFGSVNANRQHYELAAKALAQADPGWLADLITRRVPLRLVEPSAICATRPRRCGAFLAPSSSGH